ncbi:TIGR03087 family PEP-CTERM/XrtA system glycosyltransferase [Endozoicomonas sp. G2_1]|uniref:TIGR03087 family PEP-CTERM/XrtA system glycosyltransferase n=1 Tax=Endozoicomonas sp. G2_1 TaxID=2821091 RepID=UPI001AD95ADE|nr:TIGR03087 family PEP-CTERM/XrtA system glycosyltransferase [Endozoicomonas sp. G2_1]
MNILVIAQRIPYPANKGEKIRTYNQIKYLSERSNEIIVMSPAESSNDKNNATELSKQFSNVDTKLFDGASKKIKLMKGFIIGSALSVENFYCKQLQQQFDSILHTKHIDAIICTSSAMAKYIFNSRRLAELTHKPKLIMDFMDLDSDKWRQYADTSSLLMRYIYQREHKLIAGYEQKIAETFDTCYLISDKEVELFKQKISQADNVKALGNGMDTDNFYPPDTLPNNSSPVFIFTGVMDYKPNVDAVVWFVEQCWQQIIQHYPEAKFVIAGMNPNSAVSELKKYQGITVTGFVDDILPYYHGADYFVAPFRLARGVQNKILQAFACGLPVISTPMGAEGIDCINDEHILLANNADEFVKQIQRLDNDSQLKNQIRSSAINLINQKYSWSSKLTPLSQELENI